MSPGAVPNSKGAAMTAQRRNWVRLWVGVRRTELAPDVPTSMSGSL